MPKLFAPGPAAPAPASGLPNACSDALLDAEKLQVYQLAVQFQTLATQLIPRQRGLLLATLRDQLDRASVSIVLNTAEGAGRFSPSDRPASTASLAAAPPSTGATFCSPAIWWPSRSTARPQPDRPHRPNADAASRPNGHDARNAQEHVRVSIAAAPYDRGRGSRLLTVTLFRQPDRL